MAPTIRATLSVDGLSRLDGERIYCRQCGARLGVLKVSPKRPRFHLFLDAGHDRRRSDRRGVLVEVGDIAVGIEETNDGRLVMDLSPHGDAEVSFVAVALKNGQIARTWSPGHFPMLHRGDRGRCRRTEVFAVGILLSTAIGATEAGERVVI